jgi:hypothetical protein
MSEKLWTKQLCGRLDVGLGHNVTYEGQVFSSRKALAGVNLAA